MNYEIVEHYLGEKLAGYWLNYAIDNVLASETELTLELKFFNEPDKVLYIPFVIQHRRVILKGDLRNDN